MAKESKQLDWRWVWLGAGVILILVFFAVRSLTRDRLEVRVVEAAHQSLESTISTNGRIEPEMNYQEFSPLATTVKAVYAQTGDQVEAGKLVVTLDDIQARARVAAAESALRTAQFGLEVAQHGGTLAERQASSSDITRTQLDHDQAQRDLDALMKLQATGAASSSEVAAAQQRLQSTTAALEASQNSSKNRYTPSDVGRAQAAVNDAQAAVAAARDVQNRTVVRAPAAGTIYTLNVRPTDFVEEGKLILQLADLKHVRVRAYFDEPEIGSLSVGQAALIKWDARPGQVWKGHIERVPVTITQYGTRNVGEVLIAVDDDTDGLLPDTNVTVTVTTSSQANALSIPREALHAENGRFYVFRVIDNELKRTPVQHGTMNLNQVAILSGLNAGDWVATGSISGQPLQEGVPIRPVK
jgi:HlyD family secretion protein